MKVEDKRLDSEALARPAAAAEIFPLVCEKVFEAAHVGVRTRPVTRPPLTGLHDQIDPVRQPIA